MPNIVKFFRPVIAKSFFLSSLYRNWRDERELCKEPIITPLGFRFNGNRAMANGSFEPVETALIQKFFPLVSVVINIGANIGYYCCLALSEGKHVVAFEPMPINQKYLLRNVRSNEWSNSFECYPIALSDKVGLADIFGGGTGASLIKGWAGQNYSTIVPVSTLDIVLGHRFVIDQTLIIVDIEGAEYGMLKGASRLLDAECRPIWFIEISIAEHQPCGVDINPNLMETFGLFFNKGYVAFTADKKPRLISIEEIREIAETKVDTLKTHNFIFVENSMQDKIASII
jgi:FkbM family methyltransferase